MIINQLRSLLGDGVTESLIRSANQLKQGAIDTGEHYVNTFKNTLRDTPDDLFRQSDELVNESTLAMRNALEEQNLYKQHIYDMKLPEDVSQAAGRAFHKTGVDDELLDIGLRGNPDEHILALRQRNSDVFDHFAKQGINLDEEIDNVTKAMIDAKYSDDLSANFRNPFALSKSIDDTLKGMPDDMANSVRESLSRRIASPEFEKDYMNLIRLKAFQQLDEADKATLLRGLNSEHGDNLKQVFGYRKTMDNMTNNILSETERRNIIPNYTAKVYDTNVRPILVSPEVGTEMVSLGAAKFMDEIKVGDVVKYRVMPFRNFEGSNVQGALKVQGKYERGTNIDLKDDSVALNGRTINQLKEQGYRIRTVYDEAGNELDYTKIAGKEGAFKIGKVNRPLSDADELAKARVDDIHEVIGNTLNKLHTEGNLKGLRQRVERELTLSPTQGTSDLSSSSMPLFINVSDRFHNPFTGTFENVTNREASEWVRRNQQILDKEYVSLKELGIQTPYKVDYVKREYLHELFGYQNWMMSEGLGWKASMMETLFHEGIDIVRANISIKNPAVLMNNVIAGAMMQITDGVPVAMAMRNTLDAFKSIKELHFIKGRIFSLEQKGLTFTPEYTALKAQMHENIAFQAERSGVLKSFLDEGLWDKALRANPDRPFDGSLIKNILLTKDSQWGVAVRKWHDYSDMMNRVAMFKYLSHQASPEELLKKGIRSEKDIVRRVDEMFGNYSKLLPPMIAAMRKSGTVPFAQWFYRVPPFMVKQIRQHPVRALSIFAAYEGMQTLMDDKHDIDLWHGDFKDSYIGKVHTDSKYSQNALRPTNWDSFYNPIGFDPKTWIPAYMQKLDKGMPDAIGITTMPEFKKKANN